MERSTTTDEPIGSVRYFTIEAAAERLSLQPDALRARCRRRAKRDGRRVVAELGGGIIAIKLGVSWRVVFPD
jgi:formate-dependent phosphoribosylglycinamide formyltransferase (GAR transformylase)